MATLAKEGVEPPFHGICKTSCSGFDLCANFQEGLNIMMLSTSLDAKRGGLTEMVTLRAWQKGRLAHYLHLLTSLAKPGSWLGPVHSTEAPRDYDIAMCTCLQRSVSFMLWALYI